MRGLPMPYSKLKTFDVKIAQAECNLSMHQEWLDRCEPGSDNWRMVARQLSQAETRLTRLLAERHAMDNGSAPRHGPGRIRRIAKS
jgi:hypothetical protein